MVIGYMVILVIYIVFLTYNYIIGDLPLGNYISRSIFGFVFLILAYREIKKREYT